jgi:hypothetical protein
VLESLSNETKALYVDQDKGVEKGDGALRGQLVFLRIFT